MVEMEDPTDGVIVSIPEVKQGDVETSQWSNSPNEAMLEAAQR